MNFFLMFKCFLIVFVVIGLFVSLTAWIAGNNQLALFIAAQSIILAFSSSAINLLSKRLDSSIENSKLSATQLARLHKTTAKSIQNYLIGAGYIENNSGLYFLSDLGRSIGGVWKKSHSMATSQEGYFVWPITIYSKNESKKIACSE